MSDSGKRSRFRALRDIRWIVAGLTVLLIFLVAVFVFLQRGRDVPAALLTNRVLLFVLYYVNLVLILAVLFVLVRNLIKLAIERRYRILGSKFKVKLVATYIGLTLIPVMLLFAIAFEILQGSIDRWFDPSRRQGLERGRDVAQSLRDYVERHSSQGAERVLQAVADLDLDDPAGRPVLTRRLQAQLTDLDLDLLALYRGSEFVAAVLDPESGLPDLPEVSSAFVAEAAGEGEALTTRSVTGRDPDAGDGLLILAARSAPSPTVGSPPAVVVAGTTVEPRLAEQMVQLIRDYQSYRQLEVQKEEIKASHLLFFLMVTLVILLTSSWVGLYLARRVTTPIQALARGTRRISRGELDHRVTVEADDELGVLVDSFNRMTAELERNKEVIESSHQELVETNERIAAERAMIAAVVENVAAGVISLQPDGRIFTCNATALTLLHQTEDEVLGRSYRDAWDDPERAKLAALVDRAETLGGRRHGAELHLTLGGEWRTFDVKLTTMHDGSGQVSGRVLVLEDLTELIKAQQLAAWSEAARRVAHEIKNPLTPIRLAAERLLRRYEQDDPELGRALEDAVEIIVREVGSMQSMVDEFSRFARMPRPRPEEVDLPQLLDDTLHLYRDIKPGVEITGHVEPEAESVWLDREQLKRVLINLLDNAVEATPAPGSVRVEAERRDGDLEIRVSDTGPGIPPELKDKLFLPYVSTKGRGTGLGLAIVHRIVRDHQGSIRVEDNEPQGTVFTVELPLR